MLTTIGAGSKGEGEQLRTSRTIL